MPRMSIDDGFGRNPRLDHLAELCGWTRRETAGCLQLDVWPLCYDRVTPNLTVRDINIAANRDAVKPVLHSGGFAGAMIEAGLARPATKADISFEWVRKGQPNVILYWRDREWRDRVYVNGAAERIAYLVKSEESGRVGGRNSAISRANKAKGPSTYPEGTVEGRSTVPQGSRNPPDTPTAPDLVPDPDTTPDRATAPDKRRAPRTPSGPLQLSIDEFDKYYQRTHDGSRPTWKGKNAKLMNDLVTAHGYPEISRRIRILEASPPRWPSAPWDMPTFSQHFDKISSSSANMTGMDHLKAIANGDIP